MAEVIIPFGGSCPHRIRALGWVSGRYRWPVTIPPSPAGVWCKALAVMPAVATSSADVVVVGDADVWTPGLDEAIRHVEAGAPWAIPHRTVYRLTEAATSRIVSGSRGHGREPSETIPPPSCDLSERPYPGIPGGGVLVAHRELLERVPLDPRFTGWGQEDESWALALDCLVGPPWRGDAPLLHLWHPPQPRADRRRGSADGWRLRRRYLKARRDPALMLDLLAEAHDALADAQHAGDDHQPVRVG